MKNIIVLAGLAFIFGSCGNTQVVSSWKSDNISTASFHKIMVLGIINEKDRSTRTEIENALVAQLNNLGYNAVSAMQQYGPKAFDKIEEDAIVEQLKSSGFDAVITTSMLDKSKEEHYTPGRVSYQPVGIYYNRFRRYYTTIYDRVYTPGYYTTETNFFLESNMYDLNSGELVYSVQGKSFDPASAGALSYDYAKTIVGDMKKKGVLAKK
jgi:hypothetical protein